MVLSRVKSDIAAVNRHKEVIVSYYDQIVDLAYGRDDAGKGVEELRAEHVKLEDKVEVKRGEAVETIQRTEESLWKYTLRYVKSEEPGVPAVMSAALTVAPFPSPGPSMFALRPLDELSPGEISESISPQQFEDWLEAYDEYLLTGVGEGAVVPNKLKVSIFYQKLDS